MSDREPQNYRNHGRYVPGYHFVTFGLLVVYLLWRLYTVFAAFSAETVLSLLFAVAVLGVFFYARIFALTVQDRVIRLEERLRLARVLPEDLKPAIDQLTPGQLIGLRFASDGEVESLVRRVIDGSLTDRKAIKEQIQQWRPDHLRA